MSRRTRLTASLVAVMTLALAGCGGGAASAPAGSSAAPSAGICSETKDAGTVLVSIRDFAFEPAGVTAKVGEVISFTNNDAAGHTASLVDGSCTTPTIAGGASDGLVFTVAGTFPFQCNIHKTMQGTITVG